MIPEESRRAAKPTDAELLDGALEALNEARSRAPGDYLLALAVALVVAAAGLLVAAAFATGAAQDLLLNLGVEVMGALLTVVVIDGLWQRRQAATSASLDAMRRKLEARRDRPMTDDERVAWGKLVDGYHAAVAGGSWIDRVRALPHYRSRLEALEVEANETLERFG